MGKVFTTSRIEVAKLLYKAFPKICFVGVNLVLVL